MSAEHHNLLLQRLRPGPKLMAAMYMRHRICEPLMYSSKSIMAIAETSRHRCLFSSSKTNLYSPADTVGNAGLTSTMKTPMSNIAY
jgi:hypothetical protein